MDNQSNRTLRFLGWLMLGIVAVVAFCMLRAGGRSVRRPAADPGFARLVKEGISIPSLQEELSKRIDRYRSGDRLALPFLAQRATNLAVLSVRESGNPNMSSAHAVLLVDDKRHHLEIPLNIVPPVFIETLPSPPSVAEMREHVEQQAQLLIRGEKSELRLPKQQWTNIIVESFLVASNFATSWPYRAEAVLLSQGLDTTTGSPTEVRSRLIVHYTDENDWDMWYQPAR